MMKRAILGTFDTLHTLALALWLGGLFAMVVAVAPSLTSLAGTARPAEFIVTDPLRRLGSIMEISGLVMIGVQFLLRRRYQRNRALYIGDGVRQLLTFGALFLASYGWYSLFPMMESAQSLGKTNLFDSAFHTYALLARIQIALLASVVALSAWLQLPRAPSTPAASAKAASEPTSAPRRAAK